MAKRNEYFERIRRSLVEGAKEMREGTRLTRRVVILPDPPPQMTARDIVALRGKLDLTQEIFSRLLNVAPQTVQAWEQGRNRPSGATLRLLQVALRDPSVLTAVQSRPKRGHRIVCGPRPGRAARKAI